MANKKTAEKNTRKIIKMGSGQGSLGLTLPIDIIEKLKWKEHQIVVVNLKGKHIIIKDFKS